MAADYKELKDQISGLVSDLETISVEASTFQDTNKTLDEIAGTMAETCKALQEVIQQSESVYRYVNDVAVKKTLDDFSRSAEAFTSRADELISEIDQRQAALTAESKATADGLAKQVKESSDTVLEQANTKFAVLQAAINKKFWLMGGVSVAGVVVAIILALIN